MAMSVLRSSLPGLARAASTTAPRRALATAASTKKPPSLLSLADLSVEQIASLLETAASFKSIAGHSGKRDPGLLPQSLQSKNIAIMFTKRSTRTRIASETSVSSLGGHPMFLAPSDIQLGVNESLYDTAKVISSMSDGIMARVGGHDEIELLAKHSQVPVVNALSARYHPTQILADLQTMLEDSVLGGGPSTSLASLRGLKVAWIGDSNNILADMLVAYPRLGIDLAVAAPKGKAYERDEIVWGEMQDGLDKLRKSGKADYRLGDVTWSNDPLEAGKDADVVVTDTWISMGDEAQKEQRLRDFAGFQVTESMLSKAGAKPDWRFLHCLPRKGDEVDDEVFYGPRSVVFDEAENRKWTIMAIFDRIFGRWEL